MPVFDASAEFACTPETLYEFLLDPKNVLKVMPPELNARLLDGPARAEVGSRFTIEVHNLGMRQVLTIAIIALEPNRLIIDEQEEGPFRRYRHERRLTPTATGARLDERIDYEPPGGLLGLLLSARRVEGYIADLHAHRVEAIRAWLADQQSA